MLNGLFAREETTAALVLALSGTVMVLVAKGSGPLSPDRLLTRVLSNPVPRVPHAGDPGDRGARRAAPSGAAPSVAA